MHLIYAVFLCTGLGGTEPCYLSNIVPTREICEANENLYPDHRLRCAVREERPAWSMTD